MTKFNLQGLGTPINSAAYDNESAYKELLSRVNNREQLVIGCYLDKNDYPSIGIETKRVSRFKVRINQAILLLVVKYLNNDKIDDVNIDANKVEQCVIQEGKDKDQTFKTDLFKLLIDAEFTPQIAPLFRTAYGYVNAVFNFPNGRMYFRLERTDELMDYLADKNLL